MLCEGILSIQRILSIRNILSNLSNLSNQSAPPKKRGGSDAGRGGLMVGPGIALVFLVGGG